MIRSSLRYILIIGTFVCAYVALGLRPAVAQSADELRDGYTAIETRTYPHEADNKLRNLYQGLTVADVSDGMDAVGLTNTGLLSPDIQPLRRDFEDLSHRFVGIAVTVRFVPANDPEASPEMSREEFSEWKGEWYSEQAPELFTKVLREGSVVVMDNSGSPEASSIGSNNILNWKQNGAVGVVSNATARDTDEIGAQDSPPLYFKRPGRGIRPGRNELASVNRPVEVGGVQVRPGDVIVGDGDGVICVPREYAKEVARVALEINHGRQEGRERYYEELGIEPDESLEKAGGTDQQ